MNFVAKIMLEQVKKLPRDDPRRKIACDTVYIDMPILTKEDCDRFLKRERNKGKDVVDFVCILKYQMDRVFSGSSEIPDPIKIRKKENLELILDPEPHELTKNTMRIGDLIKK